MATKSSSTQQLPLTQPFETFHQLVDLNLQLATTLAWAQRQALSTWQDWVSALAVPMWMKTANV